MLAVAQVTGASRWCKTRAPANATHWRKKRPDDTSKRARRPAPKPDNKDLFRHWPAAGSVPADAGIEKRVVLFRHIEKTGGVSLRSSLQASQRQRRAGRLCEPPSCASPLSRAQASQCQFFGYQLYWTTIFRIKRFLHNLSDYKRIPHARWESSHAHSETMACIVVRPP